MNILKIILNYLISILGIKKAAEAAITNIPTKPVMVVEEPRMDYEGNEDFAKAMRFVFEQECRHLPNGKLDDGYVNDPNDPGGETKYGISKKSYPELDIKALTIQDALDIYFSDYWPIASSLKFPLNVCVFDCAVNQGVKRAAKFLLQLDEKKDWKQFNEIRVKHYIHLRDGYFKDNPMRKQYYKSWMRRINNLKKFIDEEQAG